MVLLAGTLLVLGLFFLLLRFSVTYWMEILQTSFDATDKILALLQLVAVFTLT